MPRRARDLGDHARHFEQLTRRASWRAGQICPLNVDALIHPEEMRDGLATNVEQVLTCSCNGHSDG